MATPFSLYHRFRNQGTLSEPDGIPDPRYALPSTVHWMRSLALLIDDNDSSYAKASTFYRTVQRATLNSQQENSILEHLLLALHQLSALRAMEQINPQGDIARVASVAWYYGVYAAGSAMVAAQDGSLQDNHTQTANSWDRQLVQQGKIFPPFNLRVSTLVKKDGTAEIDAFRRSPKSNLIYAPASVDDAYSYICSYLSGTRGWWEWRVTEELRSSKEFKALGVDNFRSKDAREMRDKRLSKQAISFLHQAIRFRGKANYREALYLAHGSSIETTITDFVADMSNVLHAFLQMAGAFCFGRLRLELKNEFISDVNRYRSFALDPNDIWR